MCLPSRSFIGKKVERMKLEKFNYAKTPSSPGRPIVENLPWEPGWPYVKASKVVTSKSIPFDWT